MPLGTWEPDAADTPAQLDTTTLERLASCSSAERPEQLEELLSVAERQRFASLMLLEHDQWQRATENLPDQQLIALIQFFAVAENLPGWEAGARSPVIPLARALRQRGKRLDKDTLKWLRRVNNNRFLPYGPL
jgi:hypothetical protein